MFSECCNFGRIFSEFIILKTFCTLQMILQNAE
jgi:hypothetical protein